MKNFFLIIREYFLIGWIHTSFWIKAKWWMFTHRVQIRQAINKAKDLNRMKGCQYHVIKSGQKLIVVNNRWRKNYNKIIKKRGGRRMSYIDLDNQAIYSTQ